VAYARCRVGGEYTDQLHPDNCDARPTAGGGSRQSRRPCVDGPYVSVRGGCRARSVPLSRDARSP
jgi:hypothetical protein